MRWVLFHGLFTGRNMGCEINPRCREYYRVRYFESNQRFHSVTTREYKTFRPEMRILNNSFWPGILGEYSSISATS